MKEKIKELLFKNRFWRSIFRHDMPVTSRLRSEVITWNVFLHIHPVKVFKDTLRFTKTFGLGLISFYLFIILTVTGILLMFYYIPHTGRAYHDMHDLKFAVSFGMIIRNMHRWAAHGMVAVVFLHMCRVFYTASYREPREFNWGLGIILLICTLMLSLTGYLLPWDQLAYWAITIVSRIIASAPLIGEKMKYVVLGGTTVGQNALIRFYVLHDVVLPLIAALLIAVHFWRIRKDGGLARPEEQMAFVGEKTDSKLDVDVKSYGLMNLVEGKTPQVVKEPEEMVTTWPHLLQRELSLFLLILIVIMGMSVLFDAPLEEIANPSVTPNPAKAPWYFLGLQELVSWGPAFWGGVLVPTIGVILLILIPYLDRSRLGTGVWFHPSRRLHNILFTIFVVVFVGLIIVGTFMRGLNWGFYWPWESWPAH
jgi:quinol-cytochrome oxidoreductase complex cytochrome b subunit